MSTQIFRCDINKEIKNVLIRHSVSIGDINYSFIGSTVYLYGALRRDPGGDFTPTDIENILKDLRRIDPVRNLQIDLENWSIVPDVFSWTIKKRKEAVLAVPESPKHVFISGDEEIKDVLKDMQKKGKETEGKDGKK